MAAVARAPTFLLKIALLVTLFCIGLSLATPGTAYAACTTFNFPDSHTVPSTSPMTSGGSLNVTIGTECDPVGLNPLNDPNATSPQHGSITNYNSAAGTFTYTNNGDGATSDSFTLVDASANPFTVNIAIASAVAAPVAGSVSAMVGYGSSSNAITLNLSGGAATSVAVGTQASHGTATASGTSITYTPNASYAGPDSFTYTATNAGGTSAPATVTITVSAPTISLSPSTLASGAIATAYSDTVSATGGSSPYTYAIAAGSLPPGLSLSTTTGAISGTPTGAGTYNFTITATDSSTGTGPFTSSRAYSITVAAPTISVSPSSLSAGVVGTAYSQTITASGGTSSYSFAVTAGALPAGLTLSSGGALSGTPTAGGNFNFTVTATDSSTGTGAPFSGSRSYALTITAPTITVAPTTLPSATVAAAYSQTVTASGGTSSYSFAVTAGALPAGLTLSSSGALTGTPTAGGTFNFTVTATDSSTGTGPFTGSRAYSLSVSAPTIALAPSSLPSGTAGTAYSQTITASGGIASYTYALAAGTLPTGLAFSSSGILSGTPTAAGTFNFTITATDSSTGSGPFTGSQAYSVTISAPTITVAPATLPSGTAGTAYSQTITASGGTSPYSYSLSAGSLPVGVSFSSAGVLSGTPTTAGTFNFTVTATDGNSFTGSRAYSLTIDAPTITVAPATLPAGTAGTAYSQTITASGGTGSYSYSLSAGSLPVGVSFSSAGVLSGTPTTAGTFNFTVTATDGNSFTGSRAYSLTIDAPTITVAPATLPAGTAGTAYSQTITASGGTGSYSYSLSAGSLPVGVSFSSAGVLSGTPTTAGTFNFTVTATDGNSFTGSRAYSLTIGAPTITIAPTSIASGTAGAAYSETLTASGGTGSYSYSLTAGALPPGVALSSTGVLSGTPTAGGTFNFTVTATDSLSFTGSQAYALAIAASTITIAPTTLPAGTVAAAYSQTITASGGTSTYSYAITAGALPPGLALSSAGALSGTPTASGTFNFTITATDSSTGTGPYTGSRAYSVAVGTQPPIAGNVAATVAASSSNNPITLNITGGTPTSVAVGTQASHGTATASGLSITYTPTAGYSGPDSFTYTATNASGTSAPATVSVTVSASTISIAPATLPSVALNSSYSQSITASGGTAPYNFSITAGALPAGLALSPAGILAGTPTASGTFNFTVTATDSSTGTGPFSGSRAYSLTVIANPPVAGNVTATVAANSSNNPITLNITGGAATSVAVGTPASHGTASAAGTSITYTPTPGYSGADSFTYTATNADGTSAPATVSLTVSAPTISLSPSSLPAGTTGAAYSQTVTASGGTSPYSYAITAGALPAGLTLSSSGTLSGTPISGGTFNFTVTATDSSTGTGAPFTASRAYALAIAAPTITIAPTTLPAGTVAAAYSQTITASGGTSTYSYAITAGALPPGLALSSAGALSGTPTASGTFNFTVTATDSSTGTGPYTGSRAYSVAVGAQPPIAGNVAATVAASSSNNPITLNITGGTPTSIAVGTQASHGTATASGLSITYTPTAGYSGPDSFTYTATNASGTSTPATVAITISPPTLSFSPASGALPAGMVNTAYNRTVTASGGTGPYNYGITGTLPPGLALNHSTGAITGTPTTAGNYSFSITATDANGASNSAAYTIAIAPPPTTFVFTPAGGALPEAMAGEAYSQQISATGGTGTKIYSLASGSLPGGLVLNISTGQLTGPLSAGTEGSYSFTIEVRDGNGATGTASYTLQVKNRSITVQDQVVNVPAGSAPVDVYLNRGATGGPFTSAILAFVEPANAGTATIIRGQLAQAGPATAPAGWYLHYTLNPAYSGQVRVGFRLVSALGTSNIGTITYNVSYDAGKVAEDIDRLVHDFVQSRQNMIANTIEVPGLLQRRQMQKATDPITARMMPSEQGMTLGFSTSLSQMRAAGGDPDAASAPFNVWIDGAFLAHNDKNRDDGTRKWGSFAMISMGADYLLTDKALVGLSFHYDRMTDPTDEDAELTGNGWLAGPYASLEIGKGVFWNGSLRYGGSNNTIDTQFWDGTFKTTRWMADTSIEGEWYLDEVTTLSPKLRAIYFSEKVDDYTVKNSSGDAIAIDGFDEDQFRVSLGAEIARSFVLENGTKLTPKLGLTGGFSGIDGSGAFGAVKAGLSMQTTNFWMLDTSILFNIEGDGEKSVGAKVAASKKF